MSVEAEDQESLEALARKGHREREQLTSRADLPGPHAPQLYLCPTPPLRFPGAPGWANSLQRSPGPVLQQREKREIESATCMVVNCLVPHFSSVGQSCPTLCDPINSSTPGLPVHHQLPEFTQTHIHRVGDAIQPSHPLSSPSPLAPNPSQHQSLFQ